MSTEPTSNESALPPPSRIVLRVSVSWDDRLLDVRVFDLPCRVPLTEVLQARVADGDIEGMVVDGKDGEATIAGPDSKPVSLVWGSEPVTVRVGELTYELELESREALRGLRTKRPWNRKAWLSALGSLLVQVGALACLAWMAPLSGTESKGVTDDQLQLIRHYLQASAERDVASDRVASDLADDDQGGTGTRARGEEGTMGSPSVDGANRCFGVVGPAARPWPAPGLQFGMIGLLDTGSGSRADPNFGAGGLGLGSLGTIGHGAGTAIGQGFGGDRGRLGGSHRTAGSARSSEARGPSVSGRAPRFAGAAAAPAKKQPALDGPIDPNGRFATTYRPGGGHLSAFEAAVSRGAIPVAQREIVANIGSDHAPKLPLAAGKAMAFLPSLERTLLPPSGGSFHVRFAMQSAATAPDSRPRLSVHLVLDTSGSMLGKPIAHAREAANAVLDLLQPTDDFSLVTFSTRGELLVDGGRVGSRKSAIRRKIANIEADGGTNLGDGLRLAYGQATKRTVPADAVRVVLLVSDGRANEGMTDPKRLSRLALDAFQVGVQTSTFGVGVDYDGPLMSRVASDGAGGYYYLPSSDQITDALTSELDQRLRPVATALEVRIRLHRGVELLHVYGSRRLSDGEARRVRAVEVAADKHAAKRDSIRTNRQNDQTGGMRFLIPAFAANDRHALLLKLHVPAGVGERKVGVIEVRYKDRWAKKNVTREYPIVLSYANSDAASASTIDSSVIRTIQGYMAGESLLAASRYMAVGDQARAVAVLSEREAILQRAAARYDEPQFSIDAARLARLCAQLDPRGEPLALAMLLEAAGRASL